MVSSAAANRDPTGKRGLTQRKKIMLATNFKRDALKRLSVPEFWRVGRKHPEDVATGLQSPAWWRWRSRRPSSDDTLPVLETWQGTLQAQDTLALVCVQKNSVCLHMNLIYSAHVGKMNRRFHREDRLQQADGKDSIIKQSPKEPAGPCRSGPQRDINDATGKTNYITVNNKVGSFSDRISERDNRRL